MFSSYILRKTCLQNENNKRGIIIKKKVENKRGRKNNKGVAGKSGVDGCITVFLWLSQRLSVNVGESARNTPGLLL